MSTVSQSEARLDAHVDASDWEYEYDENETEDIYFTLDLTTHVPNAIQEKQYAKNGKLVGAADPEKNVQSDANTQPAPDGNNEDDDDAANDELAEIPPPQDAGKLQILDLHTEKPYVKYNNGFYSCHWFTDLGTQFWITNPGAVRDPKFSGHVLDVVGSSQTRLVARPANLKRKRDETEPTLNEGETAAQSIAINDDAASDVSDAESRSNAMDIEQDPTKPMIVPRQKIKDPHLEAQANFMERLSALKLKKGEKDAHQIPMRVPVYYKGARNADELRASHGVVRVEVDELQPATIPEVNRVPPARDNADKDNDAGEGAPPDEDSAAAPPPKTIRRPRGGPRGGRGGGTISNAARRSNLGLELADASSLPPKKKRGRPSNAERALRAERAAALAAEQQAPGPAGSTSFVLDPLLGGESTEAGAASPPARSVTREASAAPSSTQGEHTQPRKGRRSKAQLEEAKRLDEERQAKLSEAKVAAKERRKSGEAAAGREQRPARKTRSSGAAEDFDAENEAGDAQREEEN